MDYDYEDETLEEDVKEMDESERITAIIYSDPELRELYQTDKDQAIQEARVRMYENAETDEIPLTVGDRGPRL
jgi:hypothetical protein